LDIDTSERSVIASAGLSIGAASASGIGSIYGIDGGMNSILTRKIPKNIVKLFFCVISYLITQQYEYDRCASANFGLLISE
jgi:hypothetical protein